MSQEEHLKQFASKLWLTDYLHGYRTPEDLWTFGIEDSLAVLNHVELRGRVRTLDQEAVYLESY